jgi:hypothetical protein
MLPATILQKIHDASEACFILQKKLGKHKKAKMLGKDYIFESYDVKVGEVFERHTKPEVKL